MVARITFTPPLFSDEVKLQTKLMEKKMGGSIDDYPDVVLLLLGLYLIRKL